MASARFDAMVADLLVTTPQLPRDEVRVPVMKTPETVAQNRVRKKGRREKG